MKDKIKNYLLNVFDGLGIFLNTVLGGKPIYSLFDKIRDSLRDLKNLISKD